MTTTPTILRLANIRNGLAYPHDDVCCFASCDAHHLSHGYYRIDAMPYRAVIHLLTGGEIEIIDATQHDKPLSDALRFGVPAWCRTFNRAIGQNVVHVCPWETVHIRQAANKQSRRPVVQMVRKLADLYGWVAPAVIGQNVRLRCYRNATFDDKPQRLRGLLGVDRELEAIHP